MDFQYGICRHIETVEMPWALHYMDGVDLTACNDMEFAFPLNINDPQVMMDAVQVVVDITKSKLFLPRAAHVQRKGQVIALGLEYSI